MTRHVVLFLCWYLYQIDSWKHKDLGKTKRDVRIYDAFRDRFGIFDRMCKKKMENALIED